MNKEIEKITKACVIANPSIILGEHEHYMGPDAPPEIETELRPLTLADIIVAMPV